MNDKPAYRPITYLHDRTCAKVMYLGWCTCGAGVNRCSTVEPEWACELLKGHLGDCGMTVANAPAGES